MASLIEILPVLMATGTFHLDADTIRLPLQEGLLLSPNKQHLRWITIDPVRSRRYTPSERCPGLPSTKASRRFDFPIARKVGLQ